MSEHKRIGQSAAQVAKGLPRVGVLVDGNNNLFFTRSMEPREVEGILIALSGLPQFHQKMVFIDPKDEIDPKNKIDTFKLKDEIPGFREIVEFSLGKGLVSNRVGNYRGHNIVTYSYLKNGYYTVLLLATKNDLIRTEYTPAALKDWLDRGKTYLQSDQVITTSFASSKSYNPHTRKDHKSVSDPNRFFEVSTAMYYDELSRIAKNHPQQSYSLSDKLSLIVAINCLKSLRGRPVYIGNFIKWSKQDYATFAKELPENSKIILLKNIYLDFAGQFVLNLTGNCEVRLADDCSGLLRNHVISMIKLREIQAALKVTTQQLEPSDSRSDQGMISRVAGRMIYAEVLKNKFQDPPIPTSTSSKDYSF